MQANSYYSFYNYTRAVISDAGNGITQLHQETHYFPFGLEMPTLSKNYTTPADENRYSFNGKEKLHLNNDNNLFWLDYGARMYNPALGRWHCVDPWAESYKNLSPYNYSFNNPIRFIDPDGNGPFDGVLQKASSYLANAAWNMTLATAKYVVEQVRETIDQIDVSIYGDAELKVEAQAGGSVEIEGLGIDANFQGEELASVKIGGEMDVETGEFTSTSDASYHGKDGEIKETEGGGAAFFAGGSHNKETVTNGGDVVSTKSTSKVLATPFPPAGAVSTSVVNDNGNYSVKSGYSHGFSVGAFLNFSGSIDIGIQLKKEEQE